MEVKVLNRDEIIQSIKGYTKDMTSRREKSRILRSAGANLVRFVRSIAPKRLGELAISIDIIALKAGIFVGPRLKKKYKGNIIRATYARFIEFGTKYMRPYPFMRIGFDVYGPNIIADLERAYQKLHQKTLAKNGKPF